jgi:hypothetical protein
VQHVPQQGIDGRISDPSSSSPEPAGRRRTYGIGSISSLLASSSDDDDEESSALLSGLAGRDRSPGADSLDFLSRLLDGSASPQVLQGLSSLAASPSPRSRRSRSFSAAAAGAGAGSGARYTPRAYTDAPLSPPSHHRAFNLPR